MSLQTPWEAGRFDAARGRQQILFGRMYEDAAIELEAFRAGGRILCIASAGCTALALAASHRVTAVDINPVQLAYAEQRAQGGAVRIGTAERVVGLGRRLMAVLGWRRRALETFLTLERCDKQLAFWHRHLARAPFRFVTDTFLSVGWLRTVYASPFLAVLPAHFGRVVRARLERCWQTHPNRTNPYARLLLLGDLSASTAQPVAVPDRFVCADAAGFLESSPPGSFDGFTLSNILDGAPEGYRRRLFAGLRHAAAPGAVLVLRSFAEPARETPYNRATRDRSALWGVVDVRPVQTLE
jgi:S-adenosylmethionine:diacylglycerol 3-amino-3-carboxypropyl transferase